MTRLEPLCQWLVRYGEWQLFGLGTLPLFFWSLRSRLERNGWMSISCDCNITFRWLLVTCNTVAELLPLENLPSTISVFESETASVSWDCIWCVEFRILLSLYFSPLADRQWPVGLNGHSCDSCNRRSDCECTMSRQALLRYIFYPQIHCLVSSAPIETWSTEILHNFFVFVCTDAGSTGRSSSLVWKRFHNIWNFRCSNL